MALALRCVSRREAEQLYAFPSQTNRCEQPNTLNTPRFRERPWRGHPALPPRPPQPGDHAKLRKLPSRGHIYVNLISLPRRRNIKQRDKRRENSPTKPRADTAEKLLFPFSGCSILCVQPSLHRRWGESSCQIRESAQKGQNGPSGPGLSSLQVSAQRSCAPEPTSRVSTRLLLCSEPMNLQKRIGFVSVAARTR